MKTKLTNRILSMLMAIIMMLSLTTSVFAATPAEPQDSTQETTAEDTLTTGDTADSADDTNTNANNNNESDNTAGQEDLADGIEETIPRLTDLYEGHRIHLVESENQPLPEDAELYMGNIRNEEIPYYLQRAAHALGLKTCDMYLYFIAKPMVLDAFTGDPLFFDGNDDDKMTVEVTLFDDEDMDEAEKAERLEYLQEINIEDLEVIVLGSYGDEDVVVPYDYDEETGVISFDMEKIYEFVLIIPDWDSAVYPEEEKPTDTDNTEPTNTDVGTEEPAVNTEDDGTEDGHNDTSSDSGEVTVTADGTDYSVSLTYTADANIPEGSVFEIYEVPESGILYESLTDAAAAALNTDSENIVSATFVDVDIKNDGNSITPDSDINLNIAVADSSENSDAVVQVVALGRQNEILAQEDESSYATVTDNLNSTYAIVWVTKQAKLTTSDNQTYLITVSYDRNDPGIPVAAELVVSELKEGDPGYEEYIAQSAALAEADPDALAFAKAFDISLIDPETGAECQPAGEVTVSIQLLEEEVNNDLQIDLVHFGDEPEQLDCALNNDNAIEFSTPGFSVFVVMGTVLEKKLTASDGNTYQITVTYDSKSGIPSNAELYVTEIKEGDIGYEEYVAQSAVALGEKPENLALARAFDITLKNPQTSEEYQPNKNVTVTIELLKDDLNSYASVDVVHIPDEAGEEAEVMDSTVHGESVKFKTDGFSVYVLIGSGGETVTPQCTYTFWIPNADAPGTYKEYSFMDSQGHTIFNQTVTSGDELIVPQAISNDEKTFAGWYRGDNTGGKLTLEAEPYDFDNITITENSAIDLYAVYKNYATVIFHDKYDSDSESFPVAYTRRAELITTGDGTGAVTNATVRINDLSVANTSVNGKEMAFFGWSETPITTPGAAKDDKGYDVEAVTTDAEGCITVNKEKHLYPIFIETCLLTFYAAKAGSGAAYNGPRYLNKDEYLTSLPTTSWSGKTFTGWFTGTLSGSNIEYGMQISNPDGTLIFGADDAGVYVSDGKLYMRADTTLYAGWENNISAEYRILYWQQNGNRADYTYVQSVSHTGTVGETVSVADEDKKNDRFTGFHLKEEPASAEIKADGSTVLHVYYDHNEGYEPTQEAFTLTFADSVTEEGKISPNLVQTKSVETGTGLAGQAIENPTSGRKGYKFSRWYLDPYCNKGADLQTLKMPDHDLTLYAGWELEYYFVTIDPNYGELRPLVNGKPTGTGSTWFIQSIEREPIAEYSYVERNYVESSSGTFYYVYHPGNLNLPPDYTEWPDRYTYYTTDPSKATEDTTFEYSPGTYTYAGWYEILDDGTEVPYVFGERTDHNTNLKLHWKKNGIYYIAYDAGNGTLENGSKTAVLTDGYADYAGITLTCSATPLAGYTFVGWQVRGSDSNMIYTPGQVFTLHADDAKRVSGKDIVYLDAVYARIGTASITYNANGGTVAENNVDFGKVPGSTEDPWKAATGTVDTGEGTATVSGLTNNSRFKLSVGTGFTAPAGSGATFLGWRDDAGTFYAKNSAVIYGVSASTTLYAVWGAQVTYNLNSTDAGWGNEAWNPAIYTLNAETKTYSQTANLGTVVSEPANVPIYTGEDGKLFRYWATRSGSGTESSPYVYAEYDFSQPITGALDLYAYWDAANTVNVHAIDASNADLTEKFKADGWTVTNVTVSTNVTDLTATSNVTPPDNYEFAFAAVATDPNSVSESNAVTAIKYENKKVLVKYKDESSFKVLDEGKELYFVYYQKKALDIGYKSMDASGVLDNVTTSGAPANTDSLLGEYSMSEQLTASLNLVTGFTNYAFAVGSTDPGGGTQMNASALSMITNAVGAGDPVPTLQVRNTWRGFEYKYTTETEKNAVWTSCGYAPQLYVIYYTQQPTVIMFNEKTVGTSAVTNTEFTYNLLVTATTTTTVSVQTQTKDGDNWVDSGAPAVTTTTGEPTTIFDTTASGNQPYILKNGEANSSILFYSESSNKTQGDDDGTGTREVTTTTTVTAQTAVITQTLQDAFTSSINVNGSAYTESQNVFTFTATGSRDTQNVTFTNTHKSLSVEVHVAMLESNGTGSDIVQRDSTFRNTTETTYKFDLALGESETLLTKLPSAALFTGDTDTYAYGTTMSGTGTEGAAITVGSMAVASIAYERIEDEGDDYERIEDEGDVYELVLKDGNGNTISELGSNQLYYLYYPMPKIRYVKEAIDGTLTDISGCLENPQTGIIEASESVTYGHQILTMNGKTVVQNESFVIPMSGFVISQSGNNFRMPPVLDDGLYERYLGYVKIGAGSGTATNTADLDVSTGLTMHLKVQNNTLQYSFDGAIWKNLPLSGTPTVYAIYSERGYDLQISKTVDMSQSGNDPLFSGASFTVTISSTGITKNSYDAEGADSSTIAATPATETTRGTITLTVVDGTKVRIKGLGRGEYTITESGNENYTLTARTGSIVGSSTSPMTVTDNTTVSFALDAEKKIDLINSPKAICKIDDHYFYTLRSMVNYVDENIATKTATAEMLTDYLMPAADTVEIPSDFNLTLTTAESVGHVAVITRTADLAGVPLFTSNGALTLMNLTLEGSSIEATAPMIRSAGNLVIGSGAMIQNCVGGGAINATAGNITVNGIIKKCSAAAGGAIYHSGNGTITLNGTGEIRNNYATSGSGGAIWLSGGKVKVSGTSKITGNKAESGNGGAVYANSIVEIEVDQGGAITANTAKEGGAIYANASATIRISETENVTAKPAVTGNTATTGNGGTIYVKGGGSVNVSGGSVSGNTALNGHGGTVYSNNASVTVSGTAEVNNNTAKEGGAVYAVSGPVTVSGGSVDNNTASTGSGGAVYAGSGNVTVSGGSLAGNKSAAGSGGAVYAGSGNVSVSGGSLSNNTANTDGGAVFAGSGNISVSVPSGGVAQAIYNNTATTGKGGALYANTGAVSITGMTLSKNTAGSDGGAVYAGSGAVTLTNSTFGGDDATNGNTAGGSGGALYAGSGNVTVSGGSMKNNKSTGGNGGAFYAGSGTVNVSGYTANEVTSYTQFVGNSAAAGNGGAVYLDSGSLTLTSVTATGNSAQNGAAIFTNTGRATFDAGSYTGNIASNGGAVGVSSTDARLVFNGNVQIRENKIGIGDNAPKSNVYLDKDDDAVINIGTLGSEAAIGIYVADSVENTRGVPGGRFAIYTSNNNAAKITNDRYTSLTVQSDTAAKKLYWGNSIKVSVHKLDSYGSGFTQPASSGAGTQLGKYDTYYPEFSDAALSELASELVVKNSLNIGTKVYAAAYLDGVRSFGDYITKLTWDKEASDWYVTTRSGDKVYLKKTDGTGYHRIYIYYAEPAYLSIENNTDMALTISGMMVDGISVINSNTVAGYGMVFAKNGAIRSALLPVTAEDFQLSAGQSINLLIPGGQNKAYTLDGSFETTTGGSVRLRRGAENNLSEETVTVSATDGTFGQLYGTTLNTSGTYNIIFGDNKIICKVVDAGGVEHPYSKISDAIADIVATTGTNPPYILSTAKTATIEMVTDYLLPASDAVVIPKGYSITITTAAKSGSIYNYTGEAQDGRATISRDSLNTSSMIASKIGDVNSKLTLNNLIIDGKSVRGTSAGGAVSMMFFEVELDHVDFVNVYASQGGGLYIDDWNNNARGAANSRLTAKNCSFENCNCLNSGNRFGGGAIHFFGDTVYLEKCQFSNCYGLDQAGAMFHRVDEEKTNRKPSYTTMKDCIFTNCTAKAAGGLELDSMFITVEDCTFEHCSATERNGGGFNIYVTNVKDPSFNCTTTVSGCTFIDCHVTGKINNNAGHGGGFRSNSKETTVSNCTFSNTSTTMYGGGVCFSNTNATKAEVQGCTFDKCTASMQDQSSQGGGIYSRSLAFMIGDYMYAEGETPKDLTVGSYIKDNEGNIIGRHTEVNGCVSRNEGGGIYHNRDANNSTLTITNAIVSGNQIQNSGKNGGGVYTNARTVEISGATITDNTCTSLGGGVYANTYTSLSITDSNISHNNASSNGGGVWFYYKDQNNTLTIKGSTIDNNTSNNGSGGGIYTEAKTVTVSASETRTDSEEKAIRSSISNNRSKSSGGGLYQSRNVDGAKLEISGANVNGNTVTGGAGGGIYAKVRTLKAVSSEFSRNSSSGDGAGIWFVTDDNNRTNMTLTAEGCTLDTNISGGNGGGIYTTAKTVEVKAYTEGTGEETITTGSKISNSTAAKNGGGIYQNSDIDDSSLTISSTVIRSNTANGTGNSELGGGGVYANVRNMTLTDSEVSGNTAAKYGGGIYKNSEGNDRYLIVDNTKVQNNTAGNQGGGIYDKSQLTLRKGTEITGNRLTTNTAANCAGVYLVDGRTLYVGPENAAEEDSDTIIVRNNTTSNNALSDLRLWWNSGTSENNVASVYVYCNLTNDSEIRVVNAAKAGTIFGSSKYALTNGFSDDNYVFIADNSTLHGITDRSDSTNKTIIWAGPPIAKLTDGNGRLLYLKYYEGTATYPAIFDRLDTGDGAASTVSPFSMLRTDPLTLYYRDGTVYQGTDFCIKMLVEHYETSADMTLPYVEGRTVTFTTAEKSFPSDWPYDDMDTYHFEGKAGGRATVIRGRSVASGRTLLNVKGTLKLENIVIDGGTENGVAVSNSTRCMYIDHASCIVTLGENAVLQNGKVNGYGGGVNLNNGTLNIEGGVIRNCTANNSDGGGVYLANDSSILTLAAGSIYQCSAATGGGVRIKNGSFTMSGGTIQECSSTGATTGGGGVCIASGKTMYMTGGSIINNKAQNTGGGIMVYSKDSRLYFSGKVNISGNTSVASVATNKACNVELNQDSNGVINTYNDGLYPGAYIGVYVNGEEGTNSNYDKHGMERKPFGNFKNQNSQTKTSNFYSFVNDRNGLKGGIIEKNDSNYVRTGEYADRCIYWIQIFSLDVTKKVVSGASTTIDQEELFLFKVNIRGHATVNGQLDAGQIDSANGDFGEMQFTSNGSETTTAIFGLTDGQTISGMNLSEGLTYEVIEYLTEDQAKRYAAMPMYGAGSTTESLEYEGVTYQVIRVNTYSSKIGENKERTDVDPYTSSLTFSNLMPVCKITDMNGNILYRRYDWDKVTNKEGEGQDGGSSTNQPYYYAPAVYTELTGDDGAFRALEGTLYSSNATNPTSYSVSNGVQIQMLIGDYKLNNKVTADKSKVVLTTASSSDKLFPKQDPGTTSTIRRAFAGISMFNVSGDLTFATIILDGAKGSYTVGTNGGIADVENGAKLTIQSGATLQNSKTAANYCGGAVYVAEGGSVTMTGGAVNHNESVGDGAGIYLAEGSTLNLSGAPNFGGAGTDVSGNITTATGNFKTGELIAKLNGGKTYTKARQDIYIAGFAGEDGDTSADSLVVSGNISTGDGTIWVWAAEEPRYKSLQQFAKIENGKTVSSASLKAFRNARPDQDETGATELGEYLYGITKGDDTTGHNIYWYGITGSRKVILRKISEKEGIIVNPAVSGVSFDILTSKDGQSARDKNGNVIETCTSGANGAFYVGELNYGTYYIHELNPQKYFVLKIDETGYYMCDENGNILNGPTQELR